jgi:hypothetical protein
MAESVRLNVPTDPRLRAALKSVAAASGVTMGALVNAAVLDLIENEERLEELLPAALRFEAGEGAAPSARTLKVLKIR